MSTLKVSNIQDISNNAAMSISGGVTTFNNQPLGIVTGSKVLIKTITISSDTSTVDFINGANGVVFDGTYNKYIFEAISARPVTNIQNVLVTVATNATTFPTSNYYTIASRMYSNDGIGVAEDYRASTTSLTSLQSMKASNDSSHDGIHLSLKFYRPNISTKHRVEGDYTVYTDDGYIMRGITAGLYKTTSAIVGFRFKFASGGIASGTFKLYGIK